MADVERIYEGPERAQYVQVPVASATAVEKGDMLKISGGLGVVVTAATDNLTLYAVALEAHAANSGAETINCARCVPGAIFKFNLNAATDITFGDELQISAAQALKKSGTDPVANAVKTESGATTVLCEFKVPVTLQGDAS